MTQGLQMPSGNTGLFTSAATAALVSVNLGYRPGFVLLVNNSGGTNPNVRLAIDEEANDDNLLITGSTGVITRETDANSIKITDTGFDVAAVAQTNSGRNWYFASR